ncbi:hypothetical protein GCM10010349_15320 [Streptomyces flavofungini]|nr:hypothetical protein GCM10010349_15320 [Streptomyces flavofungini]
MMEPASETATSAASRVGSYMPCLFLWLWPAVFRCRADAVAPAFRDRRRILPAPQTKQML